MRDGKRDKVKLDEFAAAVETAKNLAETNHFETVYVIDEADPSCVGSEEAATAIASSFWCEAW